jgi:hypothetical protein
MHIIAKIRSIKNMLFIFIFEIYINQILPILPRSDPAYPVNFARARVWERVRARN